MSDFKLDDDGDLDTTGGDLRLATGSEEVAQRLAARLDSWAGSYEFDQEWGKDRTLFEEPTDERLIEHHIKTLITTTDGVSTLTSYSQTRTGRQLVVSFAAKTREGLALAGGMTLDPAGTALTILTPGS